jgi:threonine/homoserine/homoserine lactone efflux protein
MLHFETVLSVALAGLALSATPGPSMLYVLSRTVGQGRAAGMASAVGLCLGGVILAVATAFGLAVVFEEFSWLVSVLKYAGSAYLVGLGTNMILNANKNANVALEVRPVETYSISSVMWQGVLVEVLNPKTVLFFALFIPPFVIKSEDQSSVHFQLLVLGALVPITAIPSDLFVAFMGGSIAKVINRATVFRKGMAWCAGLVLIGIALNIHFDFL